MNLQEFFRDFIETNKSPAACVRDGELEIVADGKPWFVDLRSVPREKWDDYVDWDVALPPGVAKYLDGHIGPLTTEESDNMEIAIEKFYGIEAPYYITASATMQSKGRSWSYVPESAIFCTGFHIAKEETYKEMVKRFTKPE
jgi:hypothetical protein